MSLGVIGSVLAAWAALNAGPYYHAVPARGPQSVLVLEVTDGDTVRAAFLVPVTIRLAGIDAPELRAKDGAGRAARDALRRLVPEGRVAVVWLGGAEKYGRTLGRFYTPGGWADDLLIRAGHARPYRGEGPRP